MTTETTIINKYHIRRGGVEIPSLDDTMKGVGQSRKDARILTTQVFHAKTITTMATWNVRTLNQTGKKDQVMNEMNKYGIDILGLCEMRWTGSGKIMHNDTTIIYSGNSKEHIRGVGLCLNKICAEALIGWKPVNDRILTAQH